MPFGIESLARRVKRKSIYLDTSVLGHWLLYYDAEAAKIAEAPRNVQRSLLLLNQIKQRLFSCSFSTSDFAFTELYQVMRDNIIANKILKDAQSLVYFHELKSQYQLTKTEVDDMIAYLDNFYSLLEKLKIYGYVVQLDMHDAQDLITDLNLSTPDAIHLAWAQSNRFYDYFVSGDRDFLEISGRVKKPRIVRASALHTFKELQAKKNQQKQASMPR